MIAILAFLSQDSEKQREERRAGLLFKYGDPGIVGKILDGMVWIGQTEEQLSESIGSPAAVDRLEKVGKTTEVWKYQPRGKRGFDLRVTVENGVVIEVDKKSA